MKVTTIRPEELGPAEIARWHGFQRAVPGLDNPFLSPEFTVAMGEESPAARVAVLTEGDDVVGFFPFERRRWGVGVPIGAHVNDCQGLVHAPGMGWDAAEVLRACGLAIWEFDHLVDPQPGFDPHLEGRWPAPIIDLSGGIEDYETLLRSRSSRFTRDLPRRSRMLGREIGDVRFELASHDAGLLDTVLAWKSAQYVRTGAPDLFARPWLPRLLHRLLATESDGFTGLLSVLHAGDRLVAGHLQLRFDGVLAGWFPAYDPDLGKYAPGLQHHLGTARAAAAAGVRHIELGKGGEDYKALLANGTLMVGTGQVTRSRVVATARAAGRAPVRRLRDVVTSSPALYRWADRVRKAHSAADSTLRRRLDPASTR
ncbi:GNAT family N-acetyltransferase [Actinomycetospora endophytica]|uniref:GNAT family N-acetyltransferase n=1 Tax=Actinomycetospora endophytica TaxID=2291215 RepID=A0ABS8PCW7_9PSEU|nr:GNAT family N-acetyltransferase [Actinomycetospora endophytica]MCD2196096.1 GNAT family N-acetyltransferase [Actinomycetospora endophytica]